MYELISSIPSSHSDTQSSVSREQDLRNLIAELQTENGLERLRELQAEHPAFFVSSVPSATSFLSKTPRASTASLSLATSSPGSRLSSPLPLETAASPLETLSEGAALSDYFSVQLSPAAERGESLSRWRDHYVSLFAVSVASCHTTTKLVNIGVE